ncbi:SDR family NAD(P)-dependent oxidoreductase [Spirosoma sp. KNUC1025]|uniref:SDR family NAD(P)-dependent oxidoreductase n=1 Tax=Spirosoma sp. KNUC1025 TaxID=2894082 RepID=UPI00386574D5|nr:SDR family oxidoreductase [Spirosoma sp. KNUC1025]
MKKLNGKKVVVIGGSRGTGLAIVKALVKEGADLLVVSRNPASLAEVAASLPGVRTLSADATAETTIASVFQNEPDLVVLAAGAMPPYQPLQQLDWDTFSTNWNTDVKAAYLIAHYALNAPVKPGTLVIFVASGAALFGSPISGGYAGSKRTQLFLANYAQEASNRLKLGLRFVGLAPLRLMQGTGVGDVVIPAYAAYSGISESDFKARMTLPQTKEDVAQSVINMALQPPPLEEGNIWFVTEKGLLIEPKLKQLMGG